MRHSELLDGKVASGKSSVRNGTLPMRRIVIDTNIYVDWINLGLHGEVIFQRDSVKYLSAVVWMELLAGAFRSAEKRLLQRVTAPFAKLDRILVPTLRAYEEAGQVLQELQETWNYDLTKTHSIVGDVLIALSARHIGATVITQNGKDYLAIQRLRSFDLAIVD